MASKGKTKDGKNESELAKQRRHALELRKAGYGYQEIADQLGLSNPGNAYRVVQNALKATYREPAQEVRKLELERLDRLMRAIWNQAIEGDGDSIDRVLRLMSRRARLLGLDLTVPDSDGTEDIPKTLRITKERDLSSVGLNGDGNGNGDSDGH